MGTTAGMFFGKATVEQFIGFIRPDGDIETTDFSPSSGSTLWEMLDEVSQDGDTTNVFTGLITSVCPTETTDDFEIRLSDPGSNPGGTETITVRVVARHDEVVGAFITRKMFFELKEGGTVKATSATFNLTGSYATYSDVLTQAQKDSISDWDSMTIRVRTDMCVENSGDSGRARVTQAEVEFA